MIIKNLTVYKSDKKILDDFNINFTKGKIHAIMGPNGSGKTTLSYSIVGHPDCIINSGEIIYKNNLLNESEIHERSLQGIYLAPQYPSVISGLSHAAFLKEAINVRNKNLGIDQLDEFEFLKLLKEKCLEFGFNYKDYIRQSLNNGFSGGEKKRNEILQISLLKPDFIILDEIDSGLDIEAMNYISKFINSYLNPEVTIIAITHYPHFAKLLNVSEVHILKNGKISQSSDISIVDSILNNGFSDL